MPSIIDAQSTIFFSKTGDTYGSFSNFYKCNFIYDDRIWSSSEHCYQAFKFEDFLIQEKIRLQPSAFMAALEGRNPATGPVRPDWKDINCDVMSNVTFAKFNQNKTEQNILVSTYGKLLVELSYKDQFWGSLPDLSGMNKLGHILMDHREFFYQTR